MLELGKKFVLFHAIWAAIVIAWLFPTSRDKHYAYARRIAYTVDRMGLYLCDWAKIRLFEYQQRHPMYGNKEKINRIRKERN